LPLVTVSTALVTRKTDPRRIIRAGRIRRRSRSAPENCGADCAAAVSRIPFGMPATKRPRIVLIRRDFGGRPLTGLRLVDSRQIIAGQKSGGSSCQTESPRDRSRRLPRRMICGSDPTTSLQPRGEEVRESERSNVYRVWVFGATCRTCRVGVAARRCLRGSLSCDRSVPGNPRRMAAPTARNSLPPEIPDPDIDDDQAGEDQGDRQLLLTASRRPGKGGRPRQPGRRASEGGDVIRLGLRLGFAGG